MPDGADDVYLDHDEYPESDEHRLALKIAGEINFSQSFSLLLGAGGFYGWVDYDLLSEIYNSSTTNYDEKMSADGTRWGVCASLGGSIKAGGITIEPFITGAYSELHLDGEGPILYGPGLTEVAVEFENERDDFMVGGGVSVLFN
jgi:hypothetical protein